MHTFILKQEQQSQCLTYQIPFTVKHVLIECGAFAFIRKHFFNNMKDLFESVTIDDILSFWKEIKLYSKV